jgi:hypothetical protein
MHAVVVAKSSISIVVRDVTTRSMAARRVASQPLGRAAGELIDAWPPLAFG